MWLSQCLPKFLSSRYNTFGNTPLFRIASIPSLAAIRKFTQTLEGISNYLFSIQKSNLFSPKTLRIMMQRWKPAVKWLHELEVLYHAIMDAISYSITYSFCTNFVKYILCHLWLISWTRSTTKIWNIYINITTQVNGHRHCCFDTLRMRRLSSFQSMGVADQYAKIFNTCSLKRIKMSLDKEWE